MQIEHRPEDYKEIVCDVLAYPVFEEETRGTSLESLNRTTRGAVNAVLSSGEFKPELYRTCRIFKPAGLKARSLLLLGAGKKSELDPARLRETAGAAVRSAKQAAAKTVAFLCRNANPANLAARAVAEGALYGNYESDI